MSWTWILPGALALSVGPMFLNNTLVVAAERHVAPMTAAECEGLARTIGRAVGIPLRTRVGQPDLPDVRGKACLMSGRATGLKATFAQAQKQVEAVFSDWTPEPDFDAGGADTAQQGFSKGAKRVVYELANDPPRGTCEDVVLAACKVPARLWTWTFKATAFVQ